MGIKNKKTSYRNLDPKSYVAQMETGAVTIINQNEEYSSQGVAADSENAFVLSVSIIHKQLIKIDNVTDHSLLPAMEQRALISLVEALIKAFKEIKTIEKGMNYTNLKPEELERLIDELEESDGNDLVENKIEECFSLSMKIIRKQLDRLNNVTESTSLTDQEQRALAAMTELVAKINRQVKALKISENEKLRIKELKK